MLKNHKINVAEMQAHSEKKSICSFLLFHIYFNETICMQPTTRWSSAEASNFVARAHEVLLELDLVGLLQVLAFQRRRAHLERRQNCVLVVQALSSAVPSLVSTQSGLLTVNNGVLFF